MVREYIKALALVFGLLMLALLLILPFVKSISRRDKILFYIDTIPNPYVSLLARLFFRKKKEIKKKNVGLTEKVKEKTSFKYFYKKKYKSE
jgi:hypothetical protein